MIEDVGNDTTLDLWKVVWDFEGFACRHHKVGKAVNNCMMGIIVYATIKWRIIMAIDINFNNQNKPKNSYVC